MKPLFRFSTNIAAVVFGIIAATSPMMTHADTHVAITDQTVMHVTKSPTCGCCEAWVDLARTAGFAVETVDVMDMDSVKNDAGVPRHLQSCHTAMIDGYVIEGHVPFSAIEKLLAERPEVTGISVPGMLAGTPGMGDYPTTKFDVVSFGGVAGDGTVFFQAGQ